MNFAEATSPKDNMADSDKSATSERFTPKRSASARMDLAAVQQKLAEMQNFHASAAGNYFWTHPQQPPPPPT
jgi:hypothetical protein